MAPLPHQTYPGDTESRAGASRGRSRPVPIWGLGLGTQPAALPGGRRLASAPPRSFPPEGQFQAPTPCKTPRRAAGRGRRVGAAAHLLRWQLGSRRSEAGERSLGGQGRGMGARAWRPLPPTPLSGPGTPGRDGSFPGGAGGALRPSARVSAAPLAGSASRYSPCPAGRGRPPRATGCSGSRRNRCRRHLLLSALQLPWRPARKARALLRSFKHDYDFYRNFMGTQGSEQMALPQLRWGCWGAGDSPPLICGPAALRSMRWAWSAHAPREPCPPAPLHPCSGSVRRGRLLRAPAAPGVSRCAVGGQRRAGAPRSRVLVKRN